MLTEQEAQALMVKLIELKKQSAENNKLKIEFQRHQNLCIEKLKYLVGMKTARYKAFGNYEDLNQEGFLALTKAMNNYDPKKGSFFWWAHKYIDTRIARSANLHTTIRFPLRIAKNNPPRKEMVMPLLIEEQYCPDKQFDRMQTIEITHETLNNLKDLQREALDLAFGITNDKPLSVNKICKKLHISRISCQELIQSALQEMREDIKI